MEEKTNIPADVPNGMLNEYLSNYDEITLGSGRLMLFAGDQKIEHLNDDFYGEGIAADDADPEHLFKIASQAEIGVFATQLGLISLYGNDYPDIPYLVKLNSKTNLVKTAQQDPVSTQMIDVRQVVEFKKNTGPEHPGGRLHRVPGQRARERHDPRGGAGGALGPPSRPAHGAVDLSARQGDQGREGTRADRRRHRAWPPPWGAISSR